MEYIEYIMAACRKSHTITCLFFQVEKASARLFFLSKFYFYFFPPTINLFGGQLILKKESCPWPTFIFIFIPPTYLQLIFGRSARYADRTIAVA
jgi:hypothetical protein